ncbi:MAG: hypothetical protein WC250_02450 [Candidatus Paceibacterota bacterium]|jgi:hypothetical protein
MANAPILRGQGGRNPKPVDEIDLDSFLGGATPGNLDSDSDVSEGENEPTPPRRQTLAPPTSDRLVVVGILLDDSGSMKDGNIYKSAIDGIHVGVEAFRGARGSDFYLIVEGFNQLYFEGLIGEVTKDSFNAYVPNHGCTPLVGTAISLVKKMQQVAEGYAAMGISASTAMLLITDGLPDDQPADFRAYVEKVGYVVGMGCALRINSDRLDEGAVRAYHACFTGMGIKTIVTPGAEPPEIRHEINQFSRSVAAIAGNA